jgi:outer membrane protein TolC
MRGLVIERSHEIRAADREAERLKVLSRRAGADRFADPSFGVRLFSERGGLEQGAAFVASVPLGGSYRRAVAEQAAAEASASALELANVKREVTVMADTDLINARTRLEAWKDAAAAAASSLEAARRTERGYQLGQIDLADLLYARRLAKDAARAEIAARSEADRALLKLQIDSHSVWIDDHDERAQ